MPTMMIERPGAVASPPRGWMSDEEWLAARLRLLTATDGPAVLGVHPWRSAMRVWGEKRGLLGPIDPSLRMEIGLFLEPKVAELFVRERGLPITLPESRLMVHPSLPWMGASIDRIVEDPLCGKGVLEIKTTTLDVDPENLPLHWQVQVQQQLEVAQLSWGFVAVLVRNEDYFSVAVERNDRFIAQLVAKLGRFWEQHILAGVPPAVDGSYCGRDALGEMYSVEDGSAVELPPESARWAATFAQATREVRRWMAIKNEATNAITAAMGAATVGIAADASRTRFSWKTQKQRATTKRQLRIEVQSQERKETRES